MCCSQREQRETLYNQDLFLGRLNLSFRITVAFIQSLSLLEILNKPDKQKARVSGAEKTSSRHLDGCVTHTESLCLAKECKGGVFCGPRANDLPPPRQAPLELLNGTISK